MKRKINQLCLFMLLGSALFSTTSCSERVDAGSEGILVNLYGSEKGVDDVSLVTGRVWYNPFTEEVYEYPTYVQTIDYPAFTINAKDGSISVSSVTCSVRGEKEDTKFYPLMNIITSTEEKFKDDMVSGTVIEISKQDYDAFNERIAKIKEG